MKPHKPDYMLLGVCILLLTLGLITLFSVSSAKGEVNFRDPLYYLKHQLLFGIAPGLFLAAIGYMTDHKLLRKLSFFILLLTLGLLFLLFVPHIGISLKGATRWVKLGPLLFQPAEFFKLGFIMYLASLFASRIGKVTRFFEVALPFMIILGFIGAILLSQPAAGTLGIIVATGMGMYFLAGGKMRDVFVVGVIGTVLFFVIIYSAPYRRERFEAFLNPSVDPQGTSYQLNQALISIGSGGLWGVGIGHSRQKYEFLPETISDSIFAIYAEEVGLFGSMLLLSLLFLFAFCGLSITKQSPDAFSRLLAGGITLWIVIQSFLNIAANAGLVPLTGVPLPFFSYGGSSMSAVLAAIGILLNISRYTRASR